MKPIIDGLKTYRKIESLHYINSEGCNVWAGSVNEEGFPVVDGVLAILEIKYIEHNIKGKSLKRVCDNPLCVKASHWIIDEDGKDNE